MKTAGAYVVNPWTNEMEPSHGAGSCWRATNSETGDERVLDWHAFYAVESGDGSIDWIGSLAARADYGRSVYVRVAARSARDAVRAAHAAVIFTPEPRQLEEW